MMKYFAIVLAVLLMATAAGYTSHAKPSRAEKMFEGKLAPEMAHAISAGNIEKIKQLIATGADINAVDKYNRTLLYWALIYNRPEAFEILLDHGAKTTIPGKPSGLTIVHAAAETGPHPEFLKMLLQHGAPVDIENGGGATPLFYAMSNPENVETLIRHGADINHQNTVGDTPLHVAALADDYKDVLLLLKAGANFTITNNQGLTFQVYMRTDMPENLFSDHALKMRDKIRAYLREHDIPVKF